MNKYVTSHEILEALRILETIRQDELPYMRVWETKTNCITGIQHGGMRFFALIRSFSPGGKFVFHLQAQNGDGKGLYVRIEEIKELQISWKNGEPVELTNEIITGLKKAKKELTGLKVSKATKIKKKSKKVPKKKKVTPMIRKIEIKAKTSEKNGLKKPTVPVFAFPQRKIKF